MELPSLFGDWARNSSRSRARSTDCTLFNALVSLTLLLDPFSNVSLCSSIIFLSLFQIVENLTLIVLQKARTGETEETMEGKVFYCPAAEFSVRVLSHRSLELRHFPSRRQASLDARAM